MGADARCLIEVVASERAVLHHGLGKLPTKRDVGGQQCLRIARCRVCSVEYGTVLMVFACAYARGAWTEVLSKSSLPVKSSIRMQPSDHMSTLGL